MSTIIVSPIDFLLNQELEKLAASLDNSFRGAIILDN